MQNNSDKFMASGCPSAKEVPYSAVHTKFLNRNRRKKIVVLSISMHAYVWTGTVLSIFVPL
jgi:hypothetical protein